MKTDLFPYLSTDSSSKSLYNIDLCFIEDESVSPPKITFITKENDRIQDLSELGISGSDLVKISFKNLYALDLQLAHAEVEESIYIINGAFASEKILDKEFLNNAAAKLKTTKIAISIPVKDCIMICDGNNQSKIDLLAFKANNLYHDFTKNALSSLIFVIEEGIITNAINPTINNEDYKESLSNNSTYQSEITKAKLFGELYNMRIVASAENIGELQNGLMHDTINLIESHKNNNDFNNTIEIISNNEDIKRNRENVQKIRMFLDRLQEKIRSQNIRINNEVKVSFLFTSDFRSGNNHKKLIKLIN